MRCMASCECDVMWCIDILCRYSGVLCSYSVCASGPGMGIVADARVFAAFVDENGNGNGNGNWGVGMNGIGGDEWNWKG